MMPVSHLAFAAGIGGLVGLGPYAWTAFVAGGMFPDLLDRTLARASGSRETWREIHRTVSHWPFFFPILMAVVAFAGAELPSLAHDAAYYFLMGGLVHVVADMFTPMGIPLYPPFTRKTRVSLNLIRAKSIWNYMFGFAPLVAYLAVLAASGRAGQGLRNVLQVIVF